MLAVGETQALPGEPGLQEAILFAKVRDHVGLLTMEPAAQCRDQQLERSTLEVYATATESTCGTLRPHPFAGRFRTS